MKKTNILNPYKITLNGKILIEASAGTGKTYTIILIYLRLILGIEKKTYNKQLTVNDILVVTFTEAAANELKNRIKKSINLIKNFYIKKNNNFKELKNYKTIISLIKNKKLAIKNLINAEHQINEAPIWTIHSFCKKILNHNFFEFTFLLKYTFITNEEQIQKQACIDFWRRTFYPLPYQIIKIITNEWNSPEKLFLEIKPYLQGDMPDFVNKRKIKESLHVRHKKNIDEINKFKHIWLENSNILYNLIIKSDINKKSYNKHYLLIWLKKITTWCSVKTEDYKFPKELIKFSQNILLKNTIGNKFPKHKIFSLIDNIFKKKYTLRDIIIFHAITNIRNIIFNEKKNKGLIGFEDLLNYVEKSLNSKNGKNISKEISNKYPIAIIDEFQDTDPKQYKIFQNIYHNNNSCLIFIGDPKQAIYGFRGANIFNYIKAKKKIKSCFTLTTNWRSSANIVAAVNQLFNNTKYPFLFKSLKYHESNSGYNNKKIGMVHKNNILSALSIFFLHKQKISLSNYQETMAYQCAYQIFDWLKESKNGNTWLYNDEKKYSVKSSDITILVKSHREAQLIHNALNQFNISSILPFNQKSIFSSKEAQDILWILQGIYFYKEKHAIQCALATKLLNLNIEKLLFFSNSEKALEMLTKEFSIYSMNWKKYGIIFALRSIMCNYQIYKKLLTDKKEGERQLINIMHLMELLQEAENKYHDQYTLIKWLEEQIKKPDPLSKKQQIRLENNKNIIQINTIHKSKGLEYPIVFLPFACYITQKTLPIFHNNNNFKKYIDLLETQESIKMYGKECLSEDLRLLYVALTRAIYHCSINIAPITIGHNRKQNSDFHKTAIGYLLQNGKSGDELFFYRKILALNSKYISTIEINNNFFKKNYQKKEKNIKLITKKFTTKINTLWNVTNFTELVSNYDNKLNNNINFNKINKNIYIKDLIPNIENINECKYNFVIDIKTKKTPHLFPKGINTGIFLHSILETISFQKIPEENWFVEKLQQARISTEWSSMLKSWITNIVNVNLIKNCFKLSNINWKNKIHETQFHIPIKNILFSKQIDFLSHKYDNISKKCNPLNFKPTTGILNGYIDLIVSWKNKYYIVDYKSNWLGENDSFYNKKNIKNSIKEHRYDLQYQIYTLAIHRYLKTHLSNYDYKKHFGGVIYIYIRGININKPGFSIYYTLPDFNFIDKLNKLFDKTNNYQND